MAVAMTFVIANAEKQREARDAGAEVFALSRPGGLAAHLSDIN